MARVHCRQKLTVTGRWDREDFGTHEASVAVCEVVVAVSITPGWVTANDVYVEHVCVGMLGPKKRRIKLAIEG